MIWAIAIYIGLSLICALVFWAACVVSARAEQLSQSSSPESEQQP